MQTWEYLRDDVHSEDELDEKLQHWGLSGWELVSVCYVRDSGGLAASGEAQADPPWKLFFKRPAV